MIHTNCLDVSCIVKLDDYGETISGNKPFDDFSLNRKARQSSTKAKFKVQTFTTHRT